MAKRVQVNRVYVYNPDGFDRLFGPVGLAAGTKVRVVNLPNAPKANKAGHCYVADPKTGDFIGMVRTGSLDHVVEPKHRKEK